MSDQADLPSPMALAIAEFLDHCLIEEGLAPLTLRTYRQVLQAMMAWLGPDVAPASLDRPAIRRWQHELIAGRRLDQATYVKYISALRSFLNFLRAEGRTTLSADDAKLPKGHVDLSAVQPLTIEEIAAVIGAADPGTPWGRRDRAILALLYSSGMRVAELCALERRSIRAEQLMTDDLMELPIVGKGRRPRVVFIDRVAQALLATYLTTRDDEFPALFRPYRGKVRPDGRLTPRMIQSAIDRYAKAVGLATSPTPHTLRHSFAVHALQGGADTRIVQAFLGHASLATTQRYTKITDRFLRESYALSHTTLTLPMH